jgi:hypothetical protein
MGAYQRLQLSSSAYADQGLTQSFTPPSNQQLEVYSAKARNASAAENAVGLFHSIATPHFKLYQLLAGGDADATTAIQAGTATSIFSTTNNDGCLFQAKEKFNMIAFNVSQAETGSPVYTYKYYNGSSYSTLTLLNTPSYSATGIQVIVFEAPTDWVVGDGSEDANSEFYSIQVIATTAPGQAVQINSLKLGKMLSYSDAVEPSGELEVSFGDEPLLLQVGEAVLPFFSYTDPSNRLELAYKISP